MSTITPEEVRKVALLAKLELPETELESMAAVLSDVLKHIAQLQKLNTDDVPPTNYVLKTQNVFRQDEVKEVFEKGKSLDNAPEKDQDYFSVPRVIE